MLGRTNTGGGGSGGLNFTVVGGTTAPSNPKENMIWINTSTAITDWVFSVTRPSAVSGRVWITTSTTSTAEFNALKKNSIQVYPISAKQYVGGAFVDKTAKSYQGGKWVEWIPSGALFWRGDERKNITGGWTESGYSLSEFPFYAFNKTGVAINFSRYPSSGGMVGGGSVNKIDLSNYNTIEFVMPTFSGENVTFGVSGSKTISWAAKIEASRAGTIKLDVASLTGSYYVVFVANYGNSTAILTEIQRV